MLFLKEYFFQDMANALDKSDWIAPIDCEFLWEYQANLEWIHFSNGQCSAIEDAYQRHFDEECLIDLRSYVLVHIKEQHQEEPIRR